jgi:hypothetical protein
MKKLLGGLVVVFAALTITASGASAASSFDSATGVATVTNDGTGASYEIADSPVAVQNGDTLTFEYRTADVTCAGGTPRVFIQGGAYNTFDADPAGPGACGTDTDGDGWFTVTGTVSGVTDGTAGHVGLVNDNPTDPGTVEFRNVTIDGASVLPPATPAEEEDPKETCKNGGWREQGYRNQGACVSEANRTR